MYSKSKYIGEKDQMRLDHDPLPNESIQKKIDYFFLNHNYEQKVNTSMQEIRDQIIALDKGSNFKGNGWGVVKKFVTSKTSDE